MCREDMIKKFLYITMMMVLSLSRLIAVDNEHVEPGSVSAIHTVASMEMVIDAPPKPNLPEEFKRIDEIYKEIDKDTRKLQGLNIGRCPHCVRVSIRGMDPPIGEACVGFYCHLCCGLCCDACIYLCYPSLLEEDLLLPEEGHSVCGDWYDEWCERWGALSTAKRWAILCAVPTLCISLPLYNKCCAQSREEEDRIVEERMEEREKEKREVEAKRMGDFQKVQNLMTEAYTRTSQVHPRWIEYPAPHQPPPSHRENPDA